MESNIETKQNLTVPYNNEVRAKFYKSLFQQMSSKHNITKSQFSRLNRFIHRYAFDKDLNLIKTVKEVEDKILSTTLSQRNKWVARKKKQERYDAKIKREKDLKASWEKARLEALDKMVTDLKEDLDTAVQHNGFIIKCRNKDLINTQFKDVQKFIDNPEEYSSFFNGKQTKRFQLVSYTDRSVWGEHIIVYPAPLKIFLLYIRWGSIENTYMQIYLHADNTNRKVRDTFSSISRRIDPNYSGVTGHSGRQGSVLLYKQGLVTLEDVYAKCSDSFKEALKEIKELN